MPSIRTFLCQSNFSFPVNQSEEWNRTAHVIEEEDEASVAGDRGGSGKSSRRPSSAGSLQSGREEKMSVQRRASSAGKTGIPAILCQLLAFLDTVLVDCGQLTWNFQIWT